MAVASQLEQRPATGDRIRAGILGGLVGGVLFAMFMMIEGLVDRGLWSAPTSIWAFWAGPDAYHPRDFEPISTFLGVMGHMMNSIIFGVVMVFLGTFGLRGAIPTLVVSVMKALVIMALMFVVILNLSPHGDIVYNSAPLWAWAVGHMMFALGIWWIAWQQQVIPR